MKLKFLSTIFCLITSVYVFGQAKTAVSQDVMTQMYDEIKTPHKYGMVMIHDDTSSMIDCATIFRQDSTWYMTYLVFEGKGYETWLAKSDNLLDWETIGTVLPYNSIEDNKWNQSAGYPSLVDHNWGGSYAISKFDNKYWMSYFGSNSMGYERGKLSIGMAYTEKDVTKAHSWNRAYQTRYDYK